MKKFSTGKIVGLSIAGIFVMFIFVLIGTYNGLVKNKETVISSASNIDTQLQRRADLIPNLVNTVKGYAAHEKEIFQELAEARSKLSGANSMQDKANAESELSGALSRLMVIVENYPNLKADSNFTALMDELSGTENRITVARKDYNNAVNVYNQKIKTFPNVMFAGMFGFESEEYFQATQESKLAPSVIF